MQKRTRKEKWSDKVEVFLVHSLTTLAVILVFVLFFLQQMATAQGNPEGFYRYFGGLQITGFMLSIPVTGGVIVQMWRLRLFDIGILPGRFLDWFFCSVLILLGFGVDAYVWLAPTQGTAVGIFLPRYVVLAWGLTHILQRGIHFWLDKYHVMTMESENDSYVNDVDQFPPAKRQDGRPETRRQSVPGPKGR